MAMLKKYNIPRILLIAVIIVSLVAFSSYTAPKARAEAFTLTSLFLMLVMSVMASLGVTLAAQALQQGIDYLQDKYVAFVSTKGFSSLTDYLTSLGVTAISQLCKPIFGALSIGKVVYDGIAEFCTWLFAEDDVVSGGDPVGELGQSVSIQSNKYSIVNEPSFTVLSDTSIHIQFNNFYCSSNITSDRTSCYTFYVPIDTSVSSFVISKSNIVNSPNYGRTFYLNVGNFVQRYDYSSWTNFNASQTGSTVTVNNPNHYKYLIIGVYGNPNYGGWNTSLDLNITGQDFKSDPGFVITPSASVLVPPSVSTGQTYNVSVTGVNSDTSVENAISTSVAPLTTTGGLTTTAAPAGTAVPSEWAWLYDGLQGINTGVESIKNNTSDDKHGTDFIPSSTTMDFGFWHYVPDWISSVGAGFSMLVGVLTSLPSIMLAPLYGILVLGIVVALFHKLWGS